MSWSACITARERLGCRRLQLAHLHVAIALRCTCHRARVPRLSRRWARRGSACSPVMRLGRPRAARMSSGVESCSGRFGRYEYSPWNAMPAGPCVLKLAAEEADVRRVFREVVRRARSAQRDKRRHAADRGDQRAAREDRRRRAFRRRHHRRAAVVVHVVEAELRVVEVVREVAELQAVLSGVASGCGRRRAAPRSPRRDRRRRRGRQRRRSGPESPEETGCVGPT